MRTEDEMPKSESTTGDHSVSFRVFQSTKYVRILQTLRKHYDSSEEQDRLVVPYVITCAAALECRLNDAYVDHAYERWQDSYRTMADSYLSMSLRGKLNALPPILTDNRYEFNQNHRAYKRLASLISVRNKLVHAKSFFEDVAVRTVPSRYPWAAPKEIIKLVSDYTLGASEEYSPPEFHEALETLKVRFFEMLPDALDGSDLVRRKGA